MLTFAYGSNMDYDQMRRRCRSVRCVSIAVLRDHRLCFPRRRRRDGTGVAGVEPCKHSKVWGVVYEISESDVDSLDCHEGFSEKHKGCEGSGNSYVREQHDVYANDEDRLTVWIYMACKQESPPRPSKEYKQKIVSGARHWNLPAEYISGLEQIQTA